MASKRVNAGGSIDDIGIKHKRGIVTIPRSAFLVGAAGASTGLGVGTPAEAELLTTSELAGISMDTADEIYALIPNIWDANQAHDIEGRIVWVNMKAGAAAGVDWTMHVKGMGDAEAISDAKVSADGSAVFAASTATAVNVQRVTEWAPLSLLEAVAGEDNQWKTRNDPTLAVAVTLADKGDAAADEVRFVMAQLRYTREICDVQRRTT